MRTGIKTLTFVVGTGRSGSTALSQVLRLHPDVLSLNELYACVDGPPALSHEPLTGREFWRCLTEPMEVFDRMVRSGTPLPEFLYNRHPEWRYSAETTGIPAVSMMALPHLTDDPDALLDALEPEVTAWPERPAPQQWEAFFGALASRAGGREAAVERSGYSLHRVELLRSLFPHARFVHLFRDGPDCALSMSRHNGYRMIALLREIHRRTGAGRDAPLGKLTEEQLKQLPDDLRHLLDSEFDPALVLDRTMPVPEFGTLWSELIREGLGQLAAVPPEQRTTLSYESLLDAPRQELARLAGFIGVQPFAEWLQEGEELFDGAGRRGSALRLPAGELAELRENCAPGEEALGVLPRPAP
ncbi:Sulfotransferase family protein [Streptomyces sp. WMMB 714]|uniref:sulfotransferase family protein n=1 Tax=Streptomyces sp. WMMB 714 TaxID=1286822 RepID=UPI0008239D5B|nr:sulfotransferase [Streptomyces sp. WMMB 714]SCK53499.1 Sulfotransferase family protein [Streptomyces sp. WMMB 714]